MKKNKIVKLEPVFNETVRVDNGLSMQNNTPLKLNRFDVVEISLKLTIEGWAFGNPVVKEELRQLMYDKVDRQIDRMQYVKDR